MEEALCILDNFQWEVVFFGLLQEIPKSICWQTAEKELRNRCHRMPAKVELANVAKVAMMGGGNTLSLAFHIVLAGAMLTVIDHLESRTEHINNGEWHLLEEISLSAGLAGAAYTLMNAAQTQPDKFTPIRATTLAACTIKYADAIILETPYPFDKLFFSHLEQIKCSGHPGQLILLDCDVQSGIELCEIIKQVYGLLPHHAFISATACPSIGSRIAPCIEDVTTAQITAFAKEFTTKTNLRRLESLSVGDRNPELTLQISRQLLMSTF